MTIMDDKSECAGILEHQRISYSKAVLISLGLDNFFAAIIAARTNVVTQMGFACRWLNRQ